ncbi:error-prone DNA polymerase [Luteolibacter flavescens]|uniref:Error-prone DNA polymerase n=1 Tax=Luteolibacter flavescens TaxID=1859460 RepID=A0ABT3FIQ0_9BACT|nr:error-prone DNA polymerase [Luteolibacter flavescens]MCW1883433.1 error-prone DNA polymerase [Luteolibacter flavescens]
MKASLPFHEFHARSAFSFLRGASDPELLMEQAARVGLSTIALTDHEGFYGSARAYHEAGKRGIRAITGATLELDGAHVPVICTTRKGYRILSRHLTNRHLKEIVEHDEMNGGDLVALTGDREGPVMRHLLRDDRDAALQAARGLVQLFGQGNVYVELLRHGLRDDAKLNRALVDLARHLRLPLLASNAPLYTMREDRLLADAFTCLRHHTALDAAGRLLEPNGERHLKSPAEMASLFADIPEALENTRELAERATFTLEKLGYEFPCHEDETGRLMSLDEQTKRLIEECDDGVKWRYGKITPKIKGQLEKEITLIGRLQLSGYFLIVQDIVRYARSQKILCQGRGSAANSVVCYVLGITSVDAVANDLVFERFLSEGPSKSEYKSWPDIDIDFPSGDQREKVIQYVFRKYGARGAAMTANVITYRGRSAFREMSKVLGFPPSIADRYSALGSTPHHWAESDDKNPKTAAELEAERKEAFEARMANLLPPSHPRLAALEKLYHAVLGLPRHLGQHSGGIVICNQGLDEVVPIQPASMPGRTIVQWDKDDCEDLGLVKIDLLGLGMLAAMEEMIEVRRRKEPDFDLAGIDLDDRRVYDMLHRSDTVGTFQVESRAQMATLSILLPNKFYEVAIQVAIVRPGPIVGKLLHPYLKRRRGDEKPDWITPEFEPILDRTLGVPLFQEQVLKMAEKIAGFTGNEAAELRRAMSFNRSDKRMREVTAKLRERMAERNVVEEVQEKVIHAIGNFSLYGFPESHALSFASIAYWSCWFKVHEPAAFYSGLLNNQPMGFYSAHSLIQDAKHHGMRILPVSCLHSAVMTEVVDDSTIRLGLHRLRGVSKETQDKIERERQREPFDSLEDFLRRVAPNAKERRILAKSGALNDLPELGHRRKAMWQVELPLFEDLLDPVGRKTGEGSEVLAPMSMPERLASDLAIQGASTGPHPMKLWRRSHTELKLANAAELQTLPHGMPVRVGGLVICRQRPGTAKGHCFISLEDETGISNLFVKKETFQRLRLVIVSESFLMAAGRVQISEGGQRTVYVEDVLPLPGAEPHHAAESHDFH